MWLSLADFELCAQVSQAEGEDGAGEHEAQAAIDRARDVYRRANVALRKTNDKAQRVQLLDEWKAFEVSSVATVDLPLFSL